MIQPPRHRVLFAWELGHGFGHVMRLKRLAQRLAAQGCDMAAAVRSLGNSRALHAIGCRLIQAPQWPGEARGLPGFQPSSVTLTDSLAQGGLEDVTAVRLLVRAWRDIIDWVEPDLLVCDYAPLATAAARGRVPIMQVGAGYFLPPASLDALPEQHGYAKALYRDADVVAWVNAALAAEGLRPLDRIGDLFFGDDVCVTTFALMDPYADHREADGPIVDAIPQPVRPDAKDIFAYLHPEVAADPRVMPGLVALGPALTLYVPNAADPLTQALAAKGAKVHRAPLDLPRALAGFSVLIHQGSAGMAAEGLAAGNLQYCLPWHIEHLLTAEALEAAGLGAVSRMFDPRVTLDPHAVLALADNADARLLADAAGRMHRAMLERRSPLDDLTERCLALLCGPDA